MPSLSEILSFDDSPPPDGCSPWVGGSSAEFVSVVAADPTWPEAFAEVEARVREALGPRVLDLIHVGSTAVPGLAAKPVIDVDLVVADPADEEAWLPLIERMGFVLRVREPWWQEHRLVRLDSPPANVHVFGPESSEPWKHRIFRDHLRRDSADLERYCRAKLAASEQSDAASETTMEYNRRKQAVIREIYARAFAAAGISA